MMNKFTDGPWSVVQAGYATMIYGPEGERVCKILDNKKDATLIEVAPDLLYIIKQLYYALPKHAEDKQWLDPDLEKMMKGAISYCKEE